MSLSKQEIKVDNRLQRIANVLLLNASFIDNLGLLNGKMGIAIFFYQYARYTGSKIFEDYAGELIDEIYEEINTTTPVDFANGLTGIGWGIEYLVKNRFLEADTDEALAEIVYEPNITGDKQFQNRPTEIFSIVDNEENWSRQLDKLKQEQYGIDRASRFGIGVIVCTNEGRIKIN